MKSGAGRIVLLFSCYLIYISRSLHASFVGKISDGCIERMSMGGFAAFACAILRGMNITLCHVACPTVVWTEQSKVKHSLRLINLYDSIYAEFFLSCFVCEDV